MTPTTVFVPTAARPAMLRTALQSIARQTAVSTVQEIVVIENGGDQSSESVCAEFSQLPIRYFFRDQPIPLGFDWFRDAIRRFQCERIAILLDDDWWMERHLENAHDALSAHPEAIASFATCLWTTGEEGYLTEAYGSFLTWFAASKPQKNHRWLLTLADLLVAGQMSTVMHYSSLVIGRDVLSKSIESFANGNPYDIDRVFSVELGRYGEVICHALPQVYIRTHQGREALRLTADDTGGRWWNKSTQRFFALAESEEINLRQEFASRMRSKNVSPDELRKYCGHNSYETLVSRGILDRQAPVETNKSLSRAVYREIAPPIFRSAINRLRKVFIA